MMAGDNEPSQNDDDLDIVNEDTNQGKNMLQYFRDFELTVERGVR
jgi:hypothetical protein